MTVTSGELPTRELLEAPELRGAWRDQSLDTGDHLFRKGDEGDALYAVIEGELEVYSTERHGERLVLECIGPGEHVGEVALIDEGPRSASVVATRPTRVRMLRRKDFFERVVDNPGLLSGVVGLQNERLRRSLGYLECLAAWAHMVAEGDYGQAQRQIRAHADAADDDNVGRFVTAFTDMLSAVQAREESLRRQLYALRIEYDQQEQHKKVEEITDSEFFQSLQANALRMRARLHEE